MTIRALIVDYLKGPPETEHFIKEIDKGPPNSWIFTGISGRTTRAKIVNFLKGPTE